MEVADMVSYEVRAASFERTGLAALDISRIHRGCGTPFFRRFAAFHIFNFLLMAYAVG
jgi:hypothetical protein